MARRVWASVGIGLGVAVCVSAGRAELPRHVAKPCPLPGIPGYDYRSSDTKPAPTATAVSLIKVDVTPAPVAGPQPATFVYQLSQARIQVDHCFLSRVAVAFHKTGEFQISFRADQNPQPGKDVRSPLKPGEQLNLPLQTAQLKRNLFVVKVRGYAAAPLNPAQPNLFPGTPVVVEFPPMEFVVQRGEPLSKTYSGYSAAVEKYFLLIDRIEVEFTYK
ncbi:hypothetical protein [Frigoriglobus tundricola]|uniref:Uncharacterized protein n=1 Tax=Frigoriglobus tundricola TaxID=2774151 RepID=A0A6M5YJG6_9BACT|nr:hypothetical protein [Frigoriglobus tundricola]QJW94229.1 hypothetical protein FTUN_1749 [Frigoriglobus tundricola]